MKTYKEVNESRQSIRQYEIGYKISREELSEIIEETVFAPSSLNMQPVRFFVVDSDEGKKRLEESVKFNKKQLDTCSAMVLIYGDIKAFENYDAIYQNAVDQGTMSLEAFNSQKERLTKYYQTIPAGELKEKIMLDAGMIVMNFMLAARNRGYDTCPIGGFDKDSIMEVVNITDSRYFPILLISIGKAEEEGHAKQRLDVNALTQWL